MDRVEVLFDDDIWMSMAMAETRAPTTKSPSSKVSQYCVVFLLNPTSKET